jgi:predicted nucleic acid-binding protein
MLYLVDTGILLRLFNRADPNCTTIRKALWELRKGGHRLVISLQNVAEFWNVSTRPTEARGGYGLSVAEADRRVRVIERIFSVLPDNPNTYSVWRNLVKHLRCERSSSS